MRGVRKLLNLRLASLDQEANSSKYVFSLVLTGSLITSSIILILLFCSLTILENHHVLPRIGFTLLIIFYLFFVRWVVSISYQAAMWMIVLLYMLVAFSVLLLWDVNSPLGILTLGFVIFLANVLLGSRFILLTLLLVAAGLTLIQLVVSLGLHTPDTTSLGRTSSFADVISYITIFGIFAITSWLSSSQLEQSLARALTAESALLQEKRLLSKRLAKQARSLRTAQLEEMRQLYRFAELGQLTSSLFHELADHLSVLHLDVKELSSSSQRVAQNRINESIDKIDTMVRSVRKQILQDNQRLRFDINACIQTAISDTEKTRRAVSSSPKIRFESKLPERYRYIYGEEARLMQVITILLNNAVQATLPGNTKPIEVNLQFVKKSIQIKIIDFGKGIPSKQQEKLFRPHHSSKEHGLGIGLFIALQFIQTHFRGTIRIDNEQPGTCFIVEFPLSAQSGSSSI